MKSLPNPEEEIKILQQDPLYVDWHNIHKDIFLSHFFCSISAEYEAKINWEIGFFDNESQKITVFTASKDNQFTIKPADDVFKQPAMKLEALELEKVSIPLDKAVDTVKVQFSKLFAQEQLGDGFLILQTYNEKTVWNFSFITKSLKFVNIKVDTSTGEITDHQAIELVQR